MKKVNTFRGTGLSIALDFQRLSDIFRGIERDQWHKIGKS